MSAFRNIMVHPSHGTRSAAITWELRTGTAPGDVYVAKSSTGLPESWECINETSPVASGAGVFTDSNLDLNSGSAEVFYRLLLESPGEDEDYSQPFSINTLLTRQEQGIVRGMLHRMFQIMRSRNGYPVWWYVPKIAGELSPKVDPDTGETLGIECPDTPLDQSAFGQKYLGGFHEPVLTWIMPRQVKRFTKRDADGGTHVAEDDSIAATVLAWPTPSRGHMVVEPITDRRYLVGDEVTPNMFRGIYPVTFDIMLEFLPQSDPRQRLPIPDFDIRTYRGL